MNFLNTFSFSLIVFLFVGIEGMLTDNITRKEKTYESISDLCPPDWKFYQNKCYIVYEGLEVTVEEAGSICKSQSAVLPSIISEEIQIFLNDLLLFTTNSSQVWTSGQKVSFSYLENTGNRSGGILWMWFNKKIAEYTKWHVGQPYAGSTSNCIVLKNIYENGQNGPYKYEWQNFYDWSAISCFAKASVICEKQACEEGWLEFKGRCYKAFTTLKLTHNEAIQYCQRNKANLISISSKIEDRFLSSLLNKTCNSPFVWTSGRCNYEHYRRYWAWQELNTKFGYTNWLQETGSNCDHNMCVNLQNQLAMSNDTRLHEHKWFYHSCTEKFPFVCRKQP